MNNNRLDHTLQENSGISRDPLFWTSMAIGGFVLLLTLWFRLGIDQSVYSYGAWLWKDYHLPPYLGSWGHNFPGTYLFYYLAFSLFGENTLSVRLLDLIIQLTNLVMIFYLSRRLAGRSIAGFLAVVFYSIFYYWIGSTDGTAKKETFIFWTFLLATVVSLRLNHKYLRAALIGSLLGLAFLLKPTYGLAWPVFGIFLLVKGRNQKLLPWLSELSLFSLFCFMPALLIIFYYWYYWGPDSLREIYFALIWFNAKIYSSMSEFGQFNWLFWVKNLSRAFFQKYPLYFLPAFFAWGTQFGKKARTKDLPLFWMLLALALVSMISYGIQGKNNLNHLFTFTGFCIIFSGWGFAQLLRCFQGWENSRPGKIVTAVFCLGLIGWNAQNVPAPGRELAVKYSFRNFEKAYKFGFGAKNDKMSAANYYVVAEYLRPLLKPGDQIACFGPYPLVPFLLKKKEPTVFVCVHHMLLKRRDGQIFPLQKKWISDYSDQTIRSRPHFIIISRKFPNEGNVYYNFMEKNPELALARLFPQLKLFMDSNYRLTTTIGQVKIYELQN